MFSAFAKWGLLLALVGSTLVACGEPTTVTLVASTSTPASTLGPTSTSTLTSTPAPTSTSTPALGVCNSADFPSGSGPIGTRQNGPPSVDFQYPPLTYSLYRGPASGNYEFLVCSPGDPASILAYMQHAIPVEGYSVLTSTESEKWTITSVTATTITAEEPTIPAAGYCYGLRMIVGQQAAYPGEWDIKFNAPGNRCTHP